MKEFLYITNEGGMPYKIVANKTAATVYYDNDYYETIEIHNSGVTKYSWKHAQSEGDVELDSIYMIGVLVEAINHAGRKLTGEWSLVEGKVIAKGGRK